MIFFPVLGTGSVKENPPQGDIEALKRSEYKKTRDSGSLRGGMKTSVKWLGYKM